MSERELYQVKEYILFPVIIDVLHHDIQKLQKTSLKMGDAYISQLRSMEHHVYKDFYKLRQTLKKNGIGVYQQKRDEHGITAKYCCRGYHHQSVMMWEYIKAQLHSKFVYYLTTN
ncbi:hypothetical protein [Longirhabdus pacifica]|uniref:hypothetical protein n=1 Tax=Longirhabdus pacifica TaxID=2305227 RepID=UPI0013E8BD55|nr:hypothetical protein [Longirhabdus pacifica]